MFLHLKWIGKSESVKVILSCLFPLPHVMGQILFPVTIQYIHEFSQEMDFSKILKIMLVFQKMPVGRAIGTGSSGQTGTGSAEC